MKLPAIVQKTVAVIYGLRCPIAGVIRYVGKSVDPEARRRSHIRDSRRYKHHTSRWIRTLTAVGMEPELVILHIVEDGERWQEAEMAFIARADELGWRLTNSTEGGEGFDYIDPVHAAMVNEKRRASSKAKWNTPEQKAAARAIGLKAWADPIAAARRRAAIGTDEVRQNQSAAALRRWSDPVKHAAGRAANSTEEKRKKLSDAAIRRATPAYRSMMAKKTKKSWIKRRVNAAA